MFESFIVHPILNVLIFIYAIIPGHNFGLAIILFTILVRLAMHPLIKKQLHHSRAMRELEPQIKKIKKATKGDSQETSRLIMELYKENEVSPFSSLATIAVQVIVLIGFYTGLRHIATDPTTIISSSYHWVRNLGVLKDLAANISTFHLSLFGLVDLSRAAHSSSGFYLPAFFLVIGSAVSQFFMGKQTLPEDKNSRSLKKILKESRSGGEKVGQTEVQDILSQGLKYVIPLFILAFTYRLPSAVALYWLVSGVVGYLQQKRILEQDETELLKASKKKPAKA